MIVVEIGDKWRLTVLINMTSVQLMKIGVTARGSVHFWPVLAAPADLKHYGARKMPVQILLRVTNTGRNNCKYIESRKKGLVPATRTVGLYSTGHKYGYCELQPRRTQLNSEAEPIKLLPKPHSVIANDSMMIGQKFNRSKLLSPPSKSPKGIGHMIHSYSESLGDAASCSTIIRLFAYSSLADKTLLTQQSTDTATGFVQEVLGLLQKEPETFVLQVFCKISGPEDLKLVAPLHLHSAAAVVESGASMMVGKAIRDAYKAGGSAGGFAGSITFSAWQAASWDMSRGKG
ncbi:hypothetical protein C8J56DRAFT_887033 [Mycena floridula]|nr:hypothetical protein C8J56DRAFT_887033 [Mycena floridula]